MADRKCQSSAAAAQAIAEIRTILAQHVPKVVANPRDIIDDLRHPRIIDLYPDR